MSFLDLVFLIWDKKEKDGKTIFLSQGLFQIGEMLVNIHQNTSKHFKTLQNTPKYFKNLKYSQTPQ